jgi:two-component system, chemotaxis family, sensor kinase CheA
MSVSIDVESLLGVFYEEAEEHLASFERGLLDLERNPNDREVIATVFRAAHSIKGASGTFGLHAITDFTHALEGVLDRLRDGALRYDADVARLLLPSLDVLRALLLAARTGGPPPASEAELRADLQRMMTGEPAPPAARSERIIAIAFVPTQHFMERGMDPLLLVRDLAELGEIVAIELDAAQVPPLEALDPEDCFVRWRVCLRTSRTDADVQDLFTFVEDSCTLETSARASPAEPAEAPEPAADVAEPPKPHPPHAPNAAHPGGGTLRVATDKLDKLADLVGELVIAQAMIVEALRSPSEDTTVRLQDALVAMERNTRELQERVMAIRMVPLGSVFGRLPRMVRDLGETCGKRVHLEIEGEGTEIDKGMVEQLVDPLTHLVRNALDHGLETPEQRAKAGKPEEGTLTIRGFHQGGNVVVEVADDGRGLPTEIIRAKAVQLGLIAQDAPLTDEQIHELVFHPGFSTAQEVSDVSGRGVGMDVVNRNVAALNGSLTLETVRGRGTRVRLRLPLTLAILDGLAVRVADQTFVLPMLSVVESFRPTAAQVRDVFGHRDVIDVRGASLPIVRLYEVLGIAGGSREPSEALVCVVESNGGRIAVLVDDVVGQMQVVVKSLEVNYRRIEAVMGATILGDGRVAMILDVQSLARFAAQPARRTVGSAAHGARVTSEDSWM